MFTAPRGTKDVLPDDYREWVFVENKVREMFEIYGYSEIRTPIFEFTELFSRCVGETTDIVEKEMYTFTDKGNRNLSLRPELTAPVVRAYLENKLFHLPMVKIYYIGPIFRYERPQAGRYRQSHQFGVEVLGSIAPSLDVEVITLAIDIFDALGIKDVEVRINSIGCRDCRPSYRETLREYFYSYASSLCEDCNRRLRKNPLRILDCKKAECIQISEEVPAITTFINKCNNQLYSCGSHFSQVCAQLESLGIEYHFCPRLVRGLDYYTKTVFEIIASSLGAQNSLCGGGRYDYLVEELGGPFRPAVGFAAGLERTLMAMKTKGVLFPQKQRMDVFIATIGREAAEDALSLLLDLRRRGICTEKDYLNRGLKGQLKEAARLNCRFAIIIGEEELSRNKVLLRNMDSGYQQEVPFQVEELIKIIKDTGD